MMAESSSYALCTPRGSLRERAGLGKRSTVLAIAAYLSLNSALALGFWRLGFPEFTLTLLFLAAFGLQARFMLRAWQSSKWIKGKLADSSTSPAGQG